MTDHGTTEITILERLRPAAAPADPETTARARRELVGRATARRHQSVRTSGRRILRRPAGAIAIVATVTFGAVAVQTTAGPLVSRAQAAVALGRAARAAAHSPAVTARPDQFLYTRTDATWSSGTTLRDGREITYLQPQLYEAWLSVDGSKAGLVRHTYGAPIFLHAGDEAALVAAGEPPARPGSTYTDVIPADQNAGTDLNDPSYAYLRSLPTNPVELYVLIGQHSIGHGQTLPQEMLTTVSDMLSFSVAPPALRAALFEVAAAIPGVSLESGSTDLAGRHGTAVALTTNGDRQELIFDPSTAELLGTRDVATVTQDGVPAGTVVGSDSTTVTVVDRAPTAPPSSDSGTWKTVLPTG